jgi:hypothetical protein
MTPPAATAKSASAQMTSFIPDSSPAISLKDNVKKDKEILRKRCQPMRILPSLPVLHKAATEPID